MEVFWDHVTDHVTLSCFPTLCHLSIILVRYKWSINWQCVTKMQQCSNGRVQSSLSVVVVIEGSITYSTGLSGTKYGLCLRLDTCYHDDARGNGHFIWFFLTFRRRRGLGGESDAHDFRMLDLCNGVTPEHCEKYWVVARRAWNILTIAMTFIMFSQLILGPYSATFLDNVPCLILHTFLYLATFECNATSDWLNRMV